MHMDKLPQRTNSPTPWIMTLNSQDQSPLDCVRKKRKVSRPIILVAGLATLCFLLLVICVALSVMCPKPVWESTMSDYQNVSERYIAASTIYNDLKKDNEVLKNRSVWLEEETKRLNVSLVKLMADNNAMTVENTKLQELQKEAQQLKEKNVLLEKELSETKEGNEKLVREVNTLSLRCPEVNQTTEETTSITCPDDWKPFETKCYYFSSETLTWNASRAWCQKEDADLVIVNSKDEQEFIFYTSQTESKTDSDAVRMWIGITDEEEEGEWKWVNGSPVRHEVQYWHSRHGESAEPDNWLDEDQLGENCGHIDYTTTSQGSWMDGSCKKLYRWICEMNM